MKSYYAAIKMPLLTSNKIKARLETMSNDTQYNDPQRYDTQHNDTQHNDT